MFNAMISTMAIKTKIIHRFFWFWISKPYSCIKYCIVYSIDIHNLRMILTYVLKISLKVYTIFIKIYN